ncbi:hypothetical protein COT64_02520 [Candidatus Shapirobacteria bacterium CG09_land_8_20_14_0_10_39_12]|uniref:Uncharacterized protein n=1 Tax=Candidatus Shapirobacteria bacterium CG09_land_8_20_14_0_10_39_12 TaxID=1974885 RepID=A0A2H0WP99_9BACT|nr:MAG: hypothetical protein COT64_02520 [Candidatus Shapirobacteria bacterium CG09_land_8_20_14_0_10_39_12]
MNRYSKEIILQACRLRSEGKTYGEIRNAIKINIPKSTLSEWCKKVSLPINYSKRISKLNFSNLNKARKIALEMNKIKREEFFNHIRKVNLPIVDKINDIKTAKIALAMLCLGEASKYSEKRSSFYLGSSDSRIIIIFLKLLQKCFNFDIEKIRCTVQCRADQDTELLKQYWINITKIPENLFYKPLIDPRTIGKPTLKKDYKGVLRVDYFNTKVQLEIESLADLVYNYLHTD